MGSSTNQSAACDPDDGYRNVAGRCLDTAFQFSLLLLLGALLLLLVGPEPETAFEYQWQLVTVCAGVSLSTIIWIVRSRRLPIFSLPILLLLTLWVAVSSSRDFEASFRVLEPAQVKQGRIIHQGLGLSYAMLPNCQVNLQPEVTRRRTRNSQKKPIAPMRLHLEEMAIVSQILLAPQSPATNIAPTVIQLEILHERSRGLNKLIRRSKGYELSMKAKPNVRILRHSHRLQLVGIDALEFEFSDDKQDRLSRQVQLQSGNFLVNFSFNTTHAADRSRIDEFLNSIRLNGSMF